MNRILFHAGLPKTGTSSIQKFCYDHLDALAARGVTIPWNAETEAKNYDISGTVTLKHIDLPNYLMGDAEPQKTGWFSRRPGSEIDWEEAFRAFRETGSQHTLLLTHESIATIAPKIQWTKLEAATAGLDRVFLVYLRDPVGWLNSRFRQAVFGEGPFIGHIGAFPIVRRYLAQGYAPFLKPLEGRGDLVLRSYNRLTADNALVADFLGLVGAGDLRSAAAHATRENEHPLGYDAVVFLRALKEIAGNAQTYCPLRDAALDAYARSVAASGEQVSEMVLPEALVQQLSARWEQDRAWLERAFSLDTSGAEPKRAQRAHFELDRAEADRLRERIRDAFTPRTAPIYEEALAAACG